MNLINEKVTHGVFGQGNIIEQNETVVTADFNGDIKKFVYPEAFGKFITLNDEKAATALREVIAENELIQREIELKREAELAQLELERERKEMLKNHKIHESSQIVFWLDEEEQENIFTDWHVFTGTVQSGKSKGLPNKAVRLRPNSASILTKRTAEQDETERIIIGLYMVNETFAGNHCEDGMVPAHEDYRIVLTDEESDKMAFWNYYINETYPERTTWNSGKYRYFNNIWTAQIVQDIISLRTDEEKVKEATDFLEYFCQMNALDKNKIPEASGALKQAE